jgi:hypothetical protein
MDQPAEFITFVVRLQRMGATEIVGVVERVKTGEKVRFEGVEGIGPAIAGILGAAVAAGTIAATAEDG